ncbi:glycosyl hydrolase family 95 catalytic domain-containing protein [uncultured Paludibaculum sp.]|uniref:glycosyl hydrolase family 95 catalytic domain-containing protein n=1 Tax=uncultured Paludibaculum sp. TaxID=1765020 RepID=UPI00374DCAF5
MICWAIAHTPRIRRNPVIRSKASATVAEPEPQHRHVSPRYALHPSEQISVSKTPALAAAARNNRRIAVVVAY